MKKILTIIMIALVLLSGVLVASPATATVTLNASIGETTANSGIRIVEGDGLPSGWDGTTFDPVFFSAPSDIQLATGVDTAEDVATGNFAVLVRRPTVSGFTVEVEGQGLKHASNDNYLAYTIKSGTVNFVVLTKEASSSYDINGHGRTNNQTYTELVSPSSILRHQKVFTYDIPIDETSPLGAYSADITFTLTTI